MANNSKIAEIYGIEIRITKKRIKRLILRVKPDSVCLSAPFWASLDDIKAFVLKNIAWIEKRREFYANLAQDSQKYIQILGKKYEICVQESQNKRDFAEICDEKFIINLHRQTQEKITEKWQKMVAREIFEELITKFQPRINREIKSLKIRKMTTRWGSCNSKKGYINLNLRLLEKPLNLVEYVVLHEMAHLIHANHGREFYALLGEIMPDYREREREINKKIANSL